MDDSLSQLIHTALSFTDGAMREHEEVVLISAANLLEQYDVTTVDKLERMLHEASFICN